MVSGERIGPSTIFEKLGEGGMGQVAIKILPDAFAADPERLARFEREAKTLAALNHPHIAAIYAVEKSGGTLALVMELVEGEDLSQRIARGVIPIDEALPIAKQIAEALEFRGDELADDNGGLRPTWGPGGRELYLLTRRGKAQRVALPCAGGSITASTPSELAVDLPGLDLAAAHPDGRILLHNRVLATDSLTLIRDWQAIDRGQR